MDSKEGPSTATPWSKSSAQMRVVDVSAEMPPELMASYRLSALATLLQRSSFLAFKRLTGLSNNESIVLMHIWEYAPVQAKQISLLTGRPKVRIDRTAALLSQHELIQRGRSLSSHDWIYDRAETGSKTYNELSAELNQREKFLIQDLGPVELNKFRALLERVTQNANAMLTPST